jgi:hypothetical protein
MRKQRLGAVLLVAFVMSSGCGAKKLTADDCENFADHIMDLTVQRMTTMLPPQRPGMTLPIAAAYQAVQGQRGTFVRECTNGMPRAAYDCLMRAASVDAMTACAVPK